MKNVPLVASALRTSDSLKALPEVIAEWNMNRFVGARADNVPSEDIEGFDNEMFPIESIVEPNRPTKGINKARVEHSMIAEEYLQNPNGQRAGRFYIADVDDIYKYWTSPRATNWQGGTVTFNNGAFPAPAGEIYNHDNITSIRPFVVYNQSVRVNKIVIKVENTWASPRNFVIETTTSSNPSESSWTYAANNTVLGDSWKPTGEMVIYWNGSSWTTGPRRDAADGSPQTTNIRGVRIRVTNLESGYMITDNGSLVRTQYRNANGTLATTDGGQSYFDLIEISARLEADLSQQVLSVSDTFDMGEVSDLYPIGTVTSNDATIELSNIYNDSNGEDVVGLFSNESSSIYSGLIDANVEFNLRYVFFNDAGAEIGRVQQFKMYADSWSESDEATVSVDLKDYSKFFNEITVRAAMWENLTVPEIVWRILDSIGFVDYVVDWDEDRVTNHRIPVFYTTGENTVWEVLDELAKASQTAIYFDGEGKLQVKTRDFAYSRNNSAVWTFTSEGKGSELPNIIRLEKTGEFEPNHFKVIYNKTNWAPDNRSQPTMQNVWEADGTEVLRSSELVQTLTRTGNKIWLTTADARLWPFSGLVSIDGEIIRYEGKEFVYQTTANSNSRRTVVIKSEDEHNMRNAKTPQGYKHNNHYTGALIVAPDGRGMWNSEPDAHPVDAAGYNPRHRTGTGTNRTSRTDVQGASHIKKESKMQLNGLARFTGYNDLLVVTRGHPVDGAYFNYGTKMKLVKETGRVTQSAGIVIHNDTTNENGYYIEIRPSHAVAAEAKPSRREITLYSRSGDSDKIIQTRHVNITEDIEYELDISFRPSGTSHRIQVWVNGKRAINATINGGDRIAISGRWGMFIRGTTKAHYEYIYAIRREEESDLPEDFSFLDKVQRGYTGNQWDREWVFRWRNRKRRPKKYSKKSRRRFNRQFFDDFGPYVHEVREYDVKFDPAPVMHSRLYMTNDWGATVVEYRANPFGAKFVVANTSRENVVINGEDTTSFAGSGDSVNQVMTLLGRGLEVSESEEIIVKDDNQIRIRGKIESELESQWIQTKGMAQALADWMSKNFSSGNEQITLEVFGNPLVEISDVVRIEYPLKNIYGDYFVNSINTSFDNGITTELTLRRRTL